MATTQDNRELQSTAVQMGWDVKQDSGPQLSLASLIAKW